MNRESFHSPFALSLSKGCPSARTDLEKGQGFGKLSPNGVYIA